MNDELLVQRITTSLDVAPLDPGLRARVMSSLPLERRRSRRSDWAPAVAVLLAVAVIAGMMAIGYFHGPRSSQPANLPHVPLTECQLPVYGYGPYGAGSSNAYETGFLNVSTGTFTANLPSSPTDFQSGRFPGPNAPAISYDRIAGIWVPAQASWVAPDGMSYVYKASDGIHVVSLREHSDRAFPARLGDLLGWSGGLVYYTNRQAYASDLWTLDPFTGTQRQVRPMELETEWWFASPDAIWGSPYYSGKIARYDTTTHVESSWNVADLVEIVGVDSSSEPIVLVGNHTNPSNRIAVMYGNGEATVLGSADDVFTADNLAVVADGDRIWISSTGQRLWVYSADTGLLFLDQTANKSLPNGLVVAGGCLSKEEARS